MNLRLMTTVFAFAAAILAAGISMKPQAAEAAPYWPWCSRYTPFSMPSCAFVSKAQCMETIAGLGGYCFMNPYVQAPGLRAKFYRHAAS